MGTKKNVSITDLSSLLIAKSCQPRVLKRSFTVSHPVLGWFCFFGFVGFGLCLCLLVLFLFLLLFLGHPVFCASAIEQIEIS